MRSHAITSLPLYPEQVLHKGVWDHPEEPLDRNKRGCLIHVTGVEFSTLYCLSELDCLSKLSKFPGS